MGLAQRIDKNRQSHVRDVLPRVRRMHIPYEDSHPDRSGYIQGFTPQAFHTNIDDGRGRDARGFHDRFAGSHDAKHTTNRFEGNRGRDEQPFHCAPRFSKRGRDPVPHSRYARPDHNRRPFDRNVQCEACKCVGHTAATCDILTQALFLTKYMLSDTMREKIEKTWLDLWNLQLDKPSRPPRTVMRTFLDTMDMTVKDLDVQMCWECWPEDDVPFEELDLHFE